jgi:predicted pyridoxine 5'-phosphate oxidase superfamily flavin-nucleotide-binding protein
MSQIYEAITPRLRRFIETQHVFFVASAPDGPGGHVNVSPKGVAGMFRVVDERTVAYLDLTASGAETIAHLRQNGRITVMFCSFDRSPKILRLHGHGRSIGRDDPAFGRWAAGFPDTIAARAVIVVDVERVADSCGYGVPLMEFAGEREMLVPHQERRGVDGLAAYRIEKNRVSIDGLPAYDADPVDA